MLEPESIWMRRLLAEAARLWLAIQTPADIDAILAKLEGWSCPWATHKMPNIFGELVWYKPMPAQMPPPQSRFAGWRGQFRGRRR